MNAIGVCQKYRPPKRENAFLKKFATDDKWNSFCLTADGCYQRHNIPRDKQYLTDQESTRKAFAGHNRVVADDRRINNMLSILASKGVNDLRADESVEEFIIRHGDVL
jgi:hypothetical protein